MESKQWTCLKCGNTSYEQDQFQATGGLFTKLCNVQSKKFTTLTCTSCKFTEIYKGDTSTLANVLDFFTN